ncbi:MAG: hypothetical protein ACE5G3_05115 [Gammaproteobacteria bacterium]
MSNPLPDRQVEDGAMPDTHSRPRALAEAAIVTGLYLLNTALLNNTSLPEYFDFLSVMGSSIPHFALTLGVVAYVYWRGNSLADFGLTVPANWRRVIIIACIGFVIALLFAAAFFAGGRNLWACIFMHALVDTFMFVITYRGLLSIA